MKISEITTLLKKHGFRKLTEDEVFNQGLEHTPKSYYKYNGDLNINIDGDALGYAIVAKKNDIGLGRFIKSYRDENGDICETGTYWEQLMIPEMIKDITNV